MKKFIYSVVILLAFTGTARAQHFCDTSQPTSGTAAVNTSHPVQICQDGKSKDGSANTIMAWTLYDNNVATPISMTKGTTSTVSGKTVYTGQYNVPSNPGSHTLQVTATGHNATGADVEGDKSGPFVLVAIAPSGPSAGTNLTVQ